MIHPHTEIKFISPEKGYGVVATKKIPKGTITWVQDKLDMVLSSRDVQKMGKQYGDILETYSFRNKDGYLVLCWDLGKYINHSFHSNCLTTAYDFELAVKDIMPGEEITDDYGYLNISEPFIALPEKGKRKVVYPDDLLKYYSQWDRRIENAMKVFYKSEQPLYQFLPSSVQEKMMQVNSGITKMDSIINCYYNPEFKKKGSRTKTG